jgi:hypothetical protein
MKKKVAILQSNYIPWKGYFDIINLVDEFIIYDEVQYTSDWRNRNIVKTQRGKEWITIPIRKCSLGQKIYETKIAFPNWNIKHWKTIQAVYVKYPLFKFYKEQFENIYMTLSSIYLSEINLIFIREINKILKIDTKITDSRDLYLTGNRNERLVDAIKKVNGSIYISGPSAKNYLDLSLFAANNIDVKWMDYSGYVEYNQPHPPFIHEVSIIDLIFCEGSNSLKFLLSSNKNFIENLSL